MGKLVGKAGARGEAREIKLTHVGGLDGLIIGHGDMDAVGSWLGVEARAVNG